MCSTELEFLGETKLKTQTKLNSSVIEDRVPREAKQGYQSFISRPHPFFEKCFDHEYHPEENEVQIYKFPTYCQ